MQSNQYQLSNFTRDKYGLDDRDSTAMCNETSDSMTVFFHAAPIPFGSTF